MSTEAMLIDEIVARVLRELGTGAIAVSAPRAPALSTAVPSAVASPPAEIALAGAVITQETLRQQAGNTRRIRVAARAILTPTARDYIRERGLDVIRDAASSEAPAAPSCQVIVTSALPQVAAALKGLRSAGFHLDERLLGSAEEAATQGTNALCRAEAELVVVLTGEPEKVACLANRNGAVRGAPVRDGAALPALRASLQPNLLAIDPAGKSQFDLKQLLKSLLIA
jgi:hypothetical protein